MQLRLQSVPEVMAHRRSERCDTYRFMAEVPKQRGELVAKFDQNLDAYRNPSYGENHVREAQQIAGRHRSPVIVSPNRTRLTSICCLDEFRKMLDKCRES